MNRAGRKFGARGETRRPFQIGLWFAAIAMSFDIASKWYIAEIVMDPPRVIPVTSSFNLVLWFNTGVSFGILGDLRTSGPLILSGLAIVIVGFLCIWLWRSQTTVEASAIGMIVGGAVGNVFDRLHDGAVTDFLDFYAGSYHWPAFNMADVAICAGAGLLVFGSIKMGRSRAAR